MRHKKTVCNTALLIIEKNPGHQEVECGVWGCRVLFVLYKHELLLISNEPKGGKIVMQEHHILMVLLFLVTAAILDS